MTPGFIAALALFAALILAVSLEILTASGHFPSPARGPLMKRPAAVLVLWLSIAVSIAALTIGLVAAVETFSWEPIVIAGGLAVLAAPLVLQQCPDRFVDGPSGLVTFAALSVVAAVPLMFLAM